MFRIYSDTHKHFMRTETDSAGMSVFFAKKETADTFNTKEEAEKFLERLKNERVWTRSFGLKVVEDEVA